MDLIIRVDTPEKNKPRKQNVRKHSGVRTPERFFYVHIIFYSCTYLYQHGISTHDLLKPQNALRDVTTAV